MLFTDNVSDVTSKLSIFRSFLEKNSDFFATPDKSLRYYYIMFRKTASINPRVFSTFLGSSQTHRLTNSLQLHRFGVLTEILNHQLETTHWINYWFVNQLLHSSLLIYAADRNKMISSFIQFIPLGGYLTIESKNHLSNFDLDLDSPIESSD